MGGSSARRKGVWGWNLLPVFIRRSEEISGTFKNAMKHKIEAVLVPIGYQFWLPN